MGKSGEEKEEEGREELEEEEELARADSVSLTPPLCAIYKIAKTGGKSVSFQLHLIKPIPKNHFDSNK